jgi:hypothetical protein
MQKQYKVLKPFSLPFFRPVEIGEIVTLDSGHIALYDLAKSVKEIKSTEAEPE